MHVLNSLVMAGIQTDPNIVEKFKSSITNCGSLFRIRSLKLQLQLLTKQVQMSTSVPGLYFT